MKIWYLSLLILCYTSCRNTPTEPARLSAALHEMPQTSTLSPELKAFGAEMNTFLSAAIHRSGTPGAAVAIVKDSQVVLLRGYGLRKNSATDSVDAHTVFRLGSLSKGFGGVLAGMLVADSLLAWDTPVQKLYPAFRLRDTRQAARIQLRHVLSHTTGLPYHAYTNMIEAGYDLDDIVGQYFPKTPITGKEGVFYAYQNAAFCLSEKMLERAAGQSWPALLQTRIFTAGGLHDASCTYQALLNCPNKALPHDWTGTYYVPAEISDKYYNFAAAGGINASAADMAAWLQLLLGQKPLVVSPSTLDQVFDPVVSTEKERRVLPDWIGRSDAWYAMGWRVLYHESDTIIYHAGAVNGYFCEIAFDRKAQLGIAVLGNAHTELSGQVIPAFFDRWAAMQAAKNQ